MGIKLSSTIHSQAILHCLVAPCMYDILKLIFPQNKLKYYQNSFLNLSTLLRCQVRGSILSAVDSALPQQQPITAHQVCFQADGGRFLCFVLAGDGEWLLDSAIRAKVSKHSNCPRNKAELGQVARAGGDCLISPPHCPHIRNIVSQCH